MGRKMIYLDDAIDAVMNTEPRFFDFDTLEPCQKTKDVVKAINDLPSAQPEKSTTDEKSQLAEEKSTRKLIYLDEAIDVAKQHWYKPDVAKALEDLPSAQPEIIHCWECIYYDPEHIEKNGVRYEYEDMPKDAFDILGTGLVNSEYGINVGGRCCRDYNVGYSEDKRVFVSKQNYCGRAERRTDEAD